MPVIQNILRKFQIALCVLIADMKKAFLQIKIREEDSHLLLVKWWKQATDGTFESQLNRFHWLPWELISAPFILNTAVRFLFIEYPKLHPEAAEDMEDHCQTTHGNILSFGKTKEEIQRKMQVAIAALEKGKMIIFKFRNHPKDAADKSITETDPDGSLPKEEFRILGLWYNTTSDELRSAFERIHDSDCKPILQNQHIAGIVVTPHTTKTRTRCKNILVLTRIF
jgi:hypothetical protein